MHRLRFIVSAVLFAILCLPAGTAAASPPDGFTEFVSAPHDVWTNTTTGKSITVRGHFVQVANRIPGTNEFTRTVTGFRYLVNKPGEGAVIRDVGRIVYDNLDESSWRDLAGQHDFPDGNDHRADTLRCHRLSLCSTRLQVSNDRTPGPATIRPFVRPSGGPVFPPRWVSPPAERRFWPIAGCGPSQSGGVGGLIFVRLRDAVFPRKHPP